MSVGGRSGYQPSLDRVNGWDASIGSRITDRSGTPAKVDGGRRDCTQMERMGRHT